MYHPHVSRQRIIPGERLLFRAQMTPHLLFSRVVNGIFVPRQIVRSREDGVARFAG